MPATIHRLTVRRRHSSREDGFHLLDSLMVLAIAGLVLALGLPTLGNWSTRLRVDLAAREIAGAFHQARGLAIRHSVRVAVKFHVADDGSATYAIYRDGDGDGVRNADLAVGVDPLLQPPRPLTAFDGRVKFGFPPGRPPRDPGGRGRLGRLQDPIRFNRSDLASFDPLGTATPGTVYLTDGRRHLAAVRVRPGTAKISVLRYDAEAEEWR